MTGVAVNVTFVPAHIVPAGFAAMLTLALTIIVTEMVIKLEVAGLPVTHARPLVITQII